MVLLDVALEPVSAGVEREAVDAADEARILHGELGRQITVLKEKAAQSKNMLKGRQVAWFCLPGCF